MKTIKEIIKKINDLELDFSIFNSRISEFANSTKNGDIDYKLLEKYISSLEDYKNLSKKYSLEINENISDKDNTEFQSQKEIVTFRLEKLDKLFDNNIKKLNLILDSNNIEKDLEEDNTPEYFKSRKEMLNLNKALYNFYNNYNKNLDYQKEYNIDISLDNDFEDNFEKDKNYSEIIESENNYIINLNHIFSDFEIIESDFMDIFNKIQKYRNYFEDNLDSFYDFYFPRNNFSYIERSFKENLETKYINKNFDIKKSDFNNESNKFKKIVKKELKEISTFYNFIKFKADYNNFIKGNYEYNIFESNKLFEELKNIFKETLNIKIINISNFTIFLKNKKIGLINITKSIEIFYNYFNIIKDYNIIKKEKIDDFNYGFFDSLFSSLGFAETIGDKFLNNFLFEIGDRLSKSLGNFNGLENIDILKKVLIETEKISGKISLAKKNIDGIVIDISRVSYKGRYTLSKTKKIVKQKLINFSGSNSAYFKPLKVYLFYIIQKKYDASKQAYINRKNRRNSSSSYSSGSSYSGSSSSYSSSSSIYSSSYSSSGSSSW